MNTLQVTPDVAASIVAIAPHDIRMAMENVVRLYSLDPGSGERMAFAEVVDSMPNALFERVYKHISDPDVLATVTARIEGALQ
jgi:hypothetical protein